MSISFSLVPNNAAASQVFVEQEPVNRGGGSPVIDRKIAIIAQYDSAKSPTVNQPQLVLNEADAWNRYGRGSMASILFAAVKRTLSTVPTYVIPVDDDGSAVAAVGELDFTGTSATESGTLAIAIGGTRVTATVVSGDDADAVGAAITDAINANSDLPVTAANTTGVVSVTVDWGGESGNQLTLETNPRDDDELPAGVSVAVTDIGDSTAGASNPDISTALGNMGDTWYTDLVIPYLDKTSIDAVISEGDTRANPGVKRPFVAFVGYTDTSSNYIDDTTGFLSDFNSEWIVSVPVHGSSSPAYEIAAATAGLFATRNQARPGVPIKGEIIPGVLSASGNDLTYATRDLVVKAGGSTTRNTGTGAVTAEDLVTTRTTTDAGADTDDWRFAVIIPNLQFKIFALENTYSVSPFAQAVVLADGGGAGPTYGVRPSTVKAYAINLIDDWVERGLSTNRDEIVAGTTAAIDSSNPGRINLLIPDVPSAGLRILAAKVEWAFVTG